MNSRFKKFFSFYRPYLGLFITDMGCAVVVAAIALIFPLCIRSVAKDALGSDTAQMLPNLLQVGALLLGLAALHTACNVFVAYRGHVMGAMMESDMRQELFDHFQKLSFGFFDNQKTGQLMSRITNDLFLLSELYHHGPEDIVIYSIKFIGAFIILFSINAPLTLAIFLFLPLMGFYAYRLNQKLKLAFQRNRERIGDINHQVEENLAGIRVVKSFANEEIEKEKFAYENRRFFDSRRNIYKHETLFFEGLTAFGQFLTVGLVVVGGLSITRASLDLADLITFLLYIGNLTEPLQQLAHVTQQYQEGLTGFSRFMDILEIEPDIQDAPDALELNAVRGRIQFQDVSFRYREGLDHVLDHIHLDIPAGDYIALVGSSGVGKTTLCSLIPRFYDVSAGRILLDGVDIRKIRLSALRRNVGVVQQDVYLFSGTVYENIRYGKPEATREEVIAAAKQANAHEFIQQLPDGYDTDIGQRGVKLSGGQKQRLSIARVFLKNPPVLIFDEATSSLDNESERVVQESLERLAANRTTLVIAHRLSTIRNARRILVLTGRGIEEEGTHAELIASGGAYAHLYHAQAG